MKRGILSAALCFLLVLGVCIAFAAEKESVLLQERPRPSCVMMKFTNATRFKALDSDEVFADLLLEKLLANRRLEMREIQPIEENLEKMLYDRETQAKRIISDAQKDGKLHALFGDTNSGKKKAMSIDSSTEGQFLDSDVTAAIGAKHRAEYLIQGTIVDIGSEKGWGGGFIFFQTSSAKISVKADIRIIRAATGEVVWLRRVTGTSKQSSTTLTGTNNTQIAAIGNAKLNSNLYARAMDDASAQVAKAIFDDMDAYKLFL